MGVAVRKDVRIFKKSFHATDSIRSSMLAAGYSQSVANTGMQGLPKKLREYVSRKRRMADKYMTLGRVVNAEEQEALTRGRLIANVVDGKDQAVNSAKLLGSDKRVSMWSADQVAAIVLIQPPAALLDRIAPQVIDAVELKALPEGEK